MAQVAHGAGAGARAQDGGPPPASPVPAAWLPPGFRLTMDPDLRRIDDGTVLVGGSPLRLLRLTPEGGALLDRLADGEPLPPTIGAQRLGRRLLDAGMAHPRPGGCELGVEDVTVVIPVRDRPLGLEITLRSLAGVGSVVVVDDGSVNAHEAQEVVGARPPAVLLRHERPRGPGAARNTGWRASETPLVAFVDADCEPAPGWLAPLLVHFADPSVAACAPRVSSPPSPPTPQPPQSRWALATSSLAAYESARSPLDRGDREAPVRPRGRVPFVPTAAIVVRRRALVALDGFDEGLLVGEDVDLVWRLHAAGWTVRYEPAASVAHPPRTSLRRWLRQRFDYGTSAAPLAARHGCSVAPLAVSAWSVGAWGLVAAGAPAAGLGVATATTAFLALRLGALDHPWLTAARLAGGGHLHAGRSIAEAVRRSWWPLAALIAAGVPRSRRPVMAAMTLPLILDWPRGRIGLGLPGWTILRLLDDLAYGSGLWAGCARERSMRALLPDLSSWPGRGAAVER